jgi:murein endopeptidase
MRLKELTMLEVQPKDSRGYFMLPQRPEDAGYYVYGTPIQGAGQYGHPAMLSLLFFIEREWQAIERRKFGIGNISLADGTKYGKHASHKDGLQVDVRALRRDGAQAGVTIFQHDLYDKHATAKLIALFRSHPSVKSILFNDTSIPGVIPWEGHDDHFHVNIRAAAK